MGEKQIYRVLSILDRLNAGERHLTKKGLAQEYGVDVKTIYRDIENINSYYLSEWSGALGDVRKIVYCSKEGYRLTGSQNVNINKSEALAMIKILLDSRAFTKDTIKELINKCISFCTPTESRVISKIIECELIHYKQLKQYDQSYNQYGMLEKIWDLCYAKEEKKIIYFSYLKEKASEPVQRIVEPRAIIFSEFYFYLIGDMHNRDFKFPTIYRLDRIVDYNIQQDSKFDVTYSNNTDYMMNEGEYRKRIQFMTGGELVNIRFKSYGCSEQAILDRLPTAIKEYECEKYIIYNAEVFGEGILMWLLSQGDEIEVLGPPKFKEKIKNLINDMVKIYL